MKKAAFVLSVILVASLSVSCGNSNVKSDSATVSETVREAVSANENEPYLSAISVFELASDDLHDAVWDSDITNTSNGFRSFASAFMEACGRCVRLRDLHDRYRCSQPGTLEVCQ